MADWTAKPDFDPPPGKTDPAPSPLDTGWAEWCKREAAAFREKKYGPGSSKAYTISLKVELVGTIEFATGGGEPSAWETEPVTSKTRPPAEYKDFTRYRRKYPKLTVAKFEVYRVTLVVEFPAPDGGKFEDTYTFWTPKGGHTFFEVFVYRWKQTSGIRQVEGRELEWYDGSISDGWNSTIQPWPMDALLLPSDDPPSALFAGNPTMLWPEGPYAALRPIRSETLLALFDAPVISEAALS